MIPATIADAADASDWRARVLARLRVHGPGILAGGIGVPIVVGQWAPLWFPIGWAVVYVVQTAFFLTYSARQRTIRAGDLWNLLTGVLFAAVPISAIVWTGHEATPWVAGVIGIVYIAFEVAILPYADVERWWGGVVTVAVAIVALVIVRIGLIPGIAMAPALFGMIAAAGGARANKTQFDARLAEVESMALTDPLTGVLNRRGLEQHLGQLDGQEVTVAVFDADRFKRINDLYGMAVGDRVLQAVADRLVVVLRDDNWSIGRLGGDEFVAFRPGHAHVPVEAVAVVAVPVVTSTRRLDIEVALSMGIATTTVVGAGDRALSEAGHALRHAKRGGGDVVRSNGALREQFERSVDVESIDGSNTPIVPVLQPIVRGDRFIGCELLARWRDTDGHLLPPSHFMEMLAENGLLGQLDNMMLRHAVAIAARLQTTRPDFLVSVNVSPMHLLEPTFRHLVGDLIDEFDVDAAGLMLEITEMDRLGTETQWERSVHELRALGVQMAIDDFGAGYSNIERLSRLPITHLKMDRSLVSTGRQPLFEIVRGVTRFCAAAGIEVIAEGIETLLEREHMCRAEVELLQGFLFGMPMDFDGFVAEIDRGVVLPACDQSPTADSLWTFASPAEQARAGFPLDPHHGASL